ncbi:recombinase family protein [Actinopolymorpha sp. B9G3]|uniref:recombinase family protein n=1 Tax=Actinopolymorpha sp. B9G3 TaxID=3158970 RepID=UPI0032D93E12
MDDARGTRCAIYLRQSLDATGDQLAVRRQQEDCHRLAAQRGWSIVAEYVDNSISASDKRRERPGYDKLVAAYDAGEFDALICWDLDRLTRQPRQLEDWIDRATDRGLLLVTANGEADLSTDAGRLFARIKASVGRNEVERKSARQRRAALQRAETGRPAWCATDRVRRRRLADRP